MATRRLAAASAIGGTVFAAWRLSGVLLVTRGSSAAVIIADGTVAILLYIWPALVAAAGLAALALSGVIHQAERRTAAAHQAHQLHELHEDIQRISVERANLRRARELIEEKERTYEDRKHSDDERIRALNTVRAHQEQVIEKLRRELEKARGELVGAREHIKRIKARQQAVQIDQRTE